MRPLVSLVDDEPTTALQRLAMVVDSANGVGAALDPADVHLHEHRHRRAPAPGADRQRFRRPRTWVDRAGRIGVTTAELFDRDGFIGTSAQTLLVQRR